MAVGVPYDLFWHLTPKKLKPFFEAFNLWRKMQDEQAYYQGFYNLKAFEVVMAHFGARLSGKKSNAKYLENPVFHNVEEKQQSNATLTEEEKQKAVDLFFAQEKARRVNWRRNHPKGGTA